MSDLDTMAYLDTINSLKARLALLRAVAEAGIQSNESLRDAITCIAVANPRPWASRVAEFDKAFSAAKDGGAL